MSVITPKDLAGKSFSSAFKGYNKTEVDEYVSKVTKNYSALYRRCAELEESLAVANLRLENIANDERKAKKALESAKEKSDCMIAEAYERADDILVAIKKNCDAILRDFRNKVDAQKDALAEMNARVEIFKKDVFSRYRTHIELLEQLTPQIDFDESYSSSEYVMRVIDDLKHEINAEYDIAVGYDDDEEVNGFEGYYSEEPDFDEMPTEEEISAFINDLARKAVEEPPAEALPAPKEEAAHTALPAEILPKEAAEGEAAEAKTDAHPADTEAAETSEAGAEATAQVTAEVTAAEEASAKDAEESKGEGEAKEAKEELPEEETKAIVIPSNKRPKKKRKRKKQADYVLEMLREFEENDAKQLPKIEAQLMLNLDDVTDSLIESPKK